MSVKINDTAANLSYLRNTGLDELLPLGTEDCTLAYWVKEETVTANFRHFSIGNVTSNNADLFATTAAGGLNTQTRGGGADSTAINTVYTRNDGWHLLVFKWEKRNAFGTFDYRATSLDGGAFTESTEPETSGAAFNQFTLGAAAFGGSVFGHVDDCFFRAVCVWNKHLSDAEVDQLYGSGPASGDALLPSLVAPGNVVMFADLNLALTGPYDVGPAFTEAGTGSDFTYADSSDPVFVLPSEGDSRARRPRLERPALRRPRYDRTFRKSWSSDRD